MKLYIIILLISIGFLAGSLLLLSVKDIYIQPAEESFKFHEANQNTDIFELQKDFFEKNSFYQAVAKAQSVGAENVIGLVAPHHLTASDIIAAGLSRTREMDIKKVIIIGPNHENLGSDSITVSKNNWETPFGPISADQRLYSAFCEDFNCPGEDYVFEKEHSIGAIIPFVKFYHPDANILPIALTSYASEQEIDILDSFLIENCDAETLLIFSLDFSHYLEKKEADKRDQITLNLIKEKNINEIMKLNNEYVDSAGALALAVKFAESKNLGIIEFEHKNSFDILIEKPNETTSYFLLGFKNIKND